MLKNQNININDIDIYLFNKKSRMAYVFISVTGINLFICRKINGYVAWSKWKEN